MRISSSDLEIFSKGPHGKENRSMPKQLPPLRGGEIQDLSIAGYQACESTVDNSAELAETNSKSATLNKDEVCRNETAKRSRSTKALSRSEHRGKSCIRETEMCPDRIDAGTNSELGSSYIHNLNDERMPCPEFDEGDFAEI